MSPMTTSAAMQLKTTTATTTNSGGTSVSRRNKRKSHEPKKVDFLHSKMEKMNENGNQDHESLTALTPPPTTSTVAPPPKKRFKQASFNDANLSNLNLPSPPTTPSPNKTKIHRPWDTESGKEDLLASYHHHFLQQEQAKAFVAFAAQEMGMSSGLLALYNLYPQLFDPKLVTPQVPTIPTVFSHSEPEQEEPLALVKSKDITKPPKVADDHHPEHLTSPKKDKVKSPPTNKANYKNMTRERRVEANARERQRVHTITAAFDTLQSLIPAPDNVIQKSSDKAVGQESSVKDILFGTKATTDLLQGKTDQRLSKLSIIKIATSYIMLLSRLAGYDYTEDKSAPTVRDCFEKCAHLLHQESKIKTKKGSD